MVSQRFLIALYLSLCAICATQSLEDEKKWHGGLRRQTGIRQTKVRRTTKATKGQSVFVQVNEPTVAATAPQAVKTARTKAAKGAPAAVVVAPAVVYGASKETKAAKGGPVTAVTAPAPTAPVAANAPKGAKAAKGGKPVPAAAAIPAPAPAVPAPALPDAPKGTKAQRKEEQEVPRLPQQTPRLVQQTEADQTEEPSRQGHQKEPNERVC